MSINWKVRQEARKREHEHEWQRSDLTTSDHAVFFCACGKSVSLSGKEVLAAREDPEELVVRRHGGRVIPGTHSGLGFSDEPRRCARCHHHETEHEGISGGSHSCTRVGCGCHDYRDPFDVEAEAGAFDKLIDGSSHLKATVLDRIKAVLADDELELGGEPFAVSVESRSLIGIRPGDTVKLDDEHVYRVTSTEHDLEEGRLTLVPVKPETPKVTIHRTLAGRVVPFELEGEEVEAGAFERAKEILSKSIEEDLKAHDLWADEVDKTIEKADELIAKHSGTGEEKE